MARDEKQTRVELINPALHERGWVEALIRVGEQQFIVQIEGEWHSILCEESGKEVLVPVEEYKQRLAEKLVEEAPGIGALRGNWVIPEKRVRLLNRLPSGEGAVRLIRELDDEQECDLFDVLAEFGYGLVPNPAVNARRLSHIRTNSGCASFLRGQGRSWYRSPDSLKKAVLKNWKQPIYLMRAT